MASEPERDDPSWVHVRDMETISGSWRHTDLAGHMKRLSDEWILSQQVIRPFVRQGRSQNRALLLPFQYSNKRHRATLTTYQSVLGVATPHTTPQKRDTCSDGMQNPKDGPHTRCPASPTHSLPSRHHANTIEKLSIVTRVCCPDERLDVVLA